MKKFFIILLLLSTLLSCSNNNLTFNGSDFTKYELDSYFELTSHKGKEKNINDFKGKVIAIFFGFVSCPDICPTTMLELKNIKSKLGENSNQLEVLFISLDPERDTPELLSKFIPSFDPSFIGLTGTIENIEKIAQQYKVYRKKVIQGSSYTIDHSSGLYLLDKEGRIRVRHSYGSEVKLIVEDIKKLF
ncbi:SCO family protein [Methylophilaceae bacterium]|jgi:protein SCO1/2|nr:SCO family protein [Methylophilaceae bacterium]|tara:strand:- start:1934 stop:2500 length:567 start_codon:yes stop_codon:yes gene_type:complete